MCELIIFAKERTTLRLKRLFVHKRPRLLSSLNRHYCEQYQKETLHILPKKAAIHTQCVFAGEKISSTRPDGFGKSNGKLLERFKNNAAPVEAMDTDEDDQIGKTISILKEHVFRGFSDFASNNGPTQSWFSQSRRGAGPNLLFDEETEAGRSTNLTTRICICVNLRNLRTNPTDRAFRSRVPALQIHQTRTKPRSNKPTAASSPPNPGFNPYELDSSLQRADLSVSSPN